MFDSYDEFDLAFALYHFLQHNWVGQSDPLYRDFCALTAPGMFKPGMSAECFDNIDDTAKEVYDQLTVENYGAVLARVLNYSSYDQLTVENYGVVLARVLNYSSEDSA